MKLKSSTYLLLAFGALKVSHLKADTSASATLNLTGAIPEVVSLIVTPSSVAASLNLNQTQTDLSVATVIESSNTSNGYVVKARSVNGGKIKHPTVVDANAEVAYSLKYAGGSSVGLSIADLILKTQAIGGVYNNKYSTVTISYTGKSSMIMPAGDYSDTITFTIESL